MTQPTFRIVLEREIARVGLTVSEFRDAMDLTREWYQRMLDPVTRKSCKCQRILTSMPRILRTYKMDVPSIMSAAYQEESELPLHCLRSPESRYRVAKFLFRLWEEEQDMKASQSYRRSIK